MSAVPYRQSAGEISGLPALLRWAVAFLVLVLLAATVQCAAIALVESCWPATAHPTGPARP